MPPTQSWQQAHRLLNRYRSTLIAWGRYFGALHALNHGTVHSRQIREYMEAAGLLPAPVHESFLGAVVKHPTFESTREKIWYACSKRNCHLKEVVLWRLAANAVQPETPWPGEIPALQRALAALEETNVESMQQDVTTPRPVWRSETFGPELADCTGCELRESCAKRAIHAQVGAKYREGGIMIIGEGPSVTEVSKGVPFTGAHQNLFEALLAASGIERDACWITYATLGLAPRTGGKATSFDKRFPNAIYSCIPRLEAEIAAARPRVIVTFGASALIAMTGTEAHGVKQVAFDCDAGCDAARKIGPALVCATGDCGWHVMQPVFYGTSSGDPLERDEEAYKDLQKAWCAEVIAKHEKRCPKCEAKITRLRARMMKCPACGGRKTRKEPFVTFEHGYGLMGRGGAAGAVFTGEALGLDEFGVRYIVPTYDVGFCARSIKDKQKRIGGQYAARALTAHLEKAKSLLKREAVFDYTVKTTQDPEEVRAWFAARRGQRLACDIETDSEDGPWEVAMITCIGFASAADHEALVVDTRHIPQWRPGRAMPPLLDAIHEYLDDETQAKVWHNGSYDRVVLARLWGIDVYGTAGDTMLAHNACYPDEEHNLAFVAHELTDAPMWKDEREKIPKGARNQFSGYSSFEALADYNAKDDRLTAMCDEIFEGPSGEHGLLDRDGQRAAYALDLDMQSIAIEMELRGLPMSVAKLTEIDTEYHAIMDREMASMRAIVGHDSFVPTGKALEWALFDPTGPLMLPVAKTTPTGKPSTAKDVLLKMAHEPFVQHLLRWRKFSYHSAHYIRSEKLTPAYDGRVHPQWKVTGARTGRWSSEPNFQNWPKTMRVAVIAPPGRKIVGADYSQLEMRLLAALCGDAELIRRCAEADEGDKLNPERDPHAYVASLTFGRTYTEAYRTGDYKTCDQLRTVAKRVVYGLNYGAGAATVLEAIMDSGYDGPPLSIRIIEAVTETYFGAFAGVPTWRRNALREAAADWAVRSPIIGRHRIFPLGQIDATVVYNYPIQSGAADIMSMRLRVLNRDLDQADPSAFLIAQVHDAIYVECAEERAVDVARCIEESLTVELSLIPDAPSMPFVATAAISDNWKDAA